MKSFQNLKIVELSSVLAGPLVGTFFAELGAKVIKVENKVTGGDVTRQWKLPEENQQHPVSAYYAAANFGKKSIFKNLKNQEDYQEVIELIATAHIVLLNFKPGDAQKLKFDHDTLSKVNPKLIYAEIIGFADNDPRVAYDVVLQAETGYMAMNGEVDSPPLKMPLAMIDIMAAHQLKEGILCALLESAIDGKGRKVSVSLYEAGLTALANQASNWLMNGHIPQRIGSLHPNIAPYGETFTCADGKWLVLAVGSDRQFEKLCQLLGLSALITDSRFETNTFRVQHRTALTRYLKEAFLKKPSSQWVPLLLENQVPFGQIKDMKEVFEEEQDSSLILEEDMEGQPTKRVKTVAFKIMG
ncbi:CaiB/BaiF CoA transferase family protein [Cecembia lonarensis]|uniref:Formyl-coenzyme A transferase n=1 Tax=Cecembia lonarensis (strain CCUG 58316 / KCTC 22772 / LW9) TaxID=1225176 RepID=K1LEX8_CECL9|nr:CaiB/BaiF CoA-transferase family protein [Cecembia lonarensis]EKB50702.1 Formyl-coenzyme A transferase [Cecembia lonarensis LW9]